MAYEKDLFDMTDEEQEQAWLEFQNRDKSLDDKEDNLEGEEPEQPLDNIEDTNEQKTEDEATEDENNTDEGEADSEDENNVEQDQGTPEQAPKTHKVKANGVEYDLTEDELVKLASKAMDYTKKMQAIAPFRKTISAMEENGLTYEDINLLIDIKKGNKEALAILVHNQGVDPYDMPSKEEVKYTPTEYGKDENLLQLQEIVTRIQNDAEYSQTQQIVSTLDPVSKQEITKHPELLEGLHFDIKNGVYHKVFPQAQKIAVLDGYSKSFLEYYSLAAQAVYKQENTSIKQQEVIKQEKQQKVQQQKKVAGLPSQGKKVTSMIDDEISDEDFEEWYRNKVANRY